MIYTQNGLISSNLTVISSNKSDFDTVSDLVDNMQTINSTNEDTIKRFKQTKLVYILPGTLKELHRSNINYKSASLILIDFDEIIDEDEFIQNVYKKMHKYSYILYPSISFGIKGVRYHLAIEPSRYFNRLEKPVINKYVNELLEMPSDTHQNTWSQLFSAPVQTPLNKDHVVINRGTAINIDRIMQNTACDFDLTSLADSIKVSKKPKTSYSKHTKVPMDLSAMPTFQALKKLVTLSNNDSQKAFREHDVPLLRQLWKQSKILNDIPANFESLTYTRKLNSLNLRGILGVPQFGSFNDVLGRNLDDRDASPSANIDLSTGLYRSFRFNVSLNCQQLLMKLGNFNNPLQLVEFLEEVTEMDFESEYQKRFQRFLKMLSQELKDMLDENSSSPLHKDFIKLMDSHNLRSIMFALISHADDYAPAMSLTGNSEDFVVFASAAQIAKEVGFLTGKVPAERTVKAHLNQLVKLGLVSKLPDEELDPVIIQRFRSRHIDGHHNKHSSVFQFSNNLELDVDEGVQRFKCSNHNSVNSNSSYNIEGTLKNKIVAQPNASNYAEIKAMKLRTIITCLIMRHGYISSNELATRIHNLPDSSKSKNWLKKEKEKIARVDNLLIGISTSRATKDFKQQLLHEYGVTLNYAPATLVYFVTDEDQLKDWVKANMKLYQVTSDMINQIDHE